MTQPDELQNIDPTKILAYFGYLIKGTDTGFLTLEHGYYPAISVYQDQSSGRLRAFYHQWLRDIDNQELFLLLTQETHYQSIAAQLTQILQTLPIPLRSAKAMTSQVMLSTFLELFPVNSLPHHNGATLDLSLPAFAMLRSQLFQRKDGALALPLYSVDKDHPCYFIFFKGEDQTSYGQNKIAYNLIEHPTSIQLLVCFFPGQLLSFMHSRRQDSFSFNLLLVPIQPPQQVIEFIKTSLGVDYKLNLLLSDQIPSLVANLQLLINLINCYQQTDRDKSSYFLHLEIDQDNLEGILFIAKQNGAWSLSDTALFRAMNHQAMNELTKNPEKLERHPLDNRYRSITYSRHSLAALDGVRYRIPIKRQLFKIVGQVLSERFNLPFTISFLTITSNSYE